MPASPREEGWDQRFLVDPARLEEVVELYTRAGFEVRAEPAVPADLRSECESCGLVRAGIFRMIYTRRPPAGGANP